MVSASDPLPSSAWRPRSASAALSVVALGVAGVAALILDAVAPGAGPLVQPLSSFAHTDYAWLWRLSVGAGSVGVLLLAFTLRPPSVSRSFRALLVAAGVGLAAVGAFPTDLWFPWERALTPTGTLHVASVLLVVAAFGAAMLCCARSAPGTRIRASCRACGVAYWTILAGSSAYVAAAVAAARTPQLVGLGERLLLGAALAWCGLLAGADAPAG